MSVLELNLRAKPKATQPPISIPIPDKGDFIEVGKKYVLNCGIIIGPMKEASYGHAWLETDQGTWSNVLSKPAACGYIWYKSNGGFVPCGPEDPRSIRCEWHETWEQEEAWKAGGQLLRYDPISNTWYLGGHSYAVICKAFGENSQTTKEWWQINNAFLVKKGLLKVVK